MHSACAITAWQCNFAEEVPTKGGSSVRVRNAAYMWQHSDDIGQADGNNNNHNKHDDDNGSVGVHNKYMLHMLLPPTSQLFKDSACSLVIE